MRIGQGFDVHAFAEGRPLILGGIEIPHDRGLLGHSDADVLGRGLESVVAARLATRQSGRLCARQRRCDSDGGAAKASHVHRRYASGHRRVARGRHQPSERQSDDD